MNQKCLTTIFVPVQPLNFNINPPSICQKHQKPLSYYNKYKPDDEPICIDCLLDETKTGTESNLYIPNGVETGEVIKIAGKGYKDGKGSRGDLFVNINSFNYFIH